MAAAASAATMLFTLTAWSTSMAASGQVSSLSSGDIGRAAPDGGPRAVVIDPGVVVNLADPGVDLTPPADGRLRGDGISLLVTGAALVDRAGTDIQVVSAGPGRHLIVFGFRQIVQTYDPSAPPASLALVVGGDRRSVELPNRDGEGPWYNAAAIPAGATDVSLVLSSAGFSQRFSLMTLSRPGPDPAVLYRDVDNPAVVQTDSSAVGVVATTGPPDSSSYRQLIGAATTTISWFSPDPSLRTAPSPDKAFLSVQLDVKPSLDNNNFYGLHLNLPSAYPASHVHLVMSDSSRLDATHSGADDNSFSGIYYFTVPADISAATLSVDTYSAPGEIITVGVTHSVITYQAFTIPLALSKAPASPPATTASTVLKLTGTGSAAAGSSQAVTASRSAGGGISPIVPLAATAVIAAVVALATRRRHRLPVPLPVAHTPGGELNGSMPPANAADWMAAPSPAAPTPQPTAPSWQPKPPPTPPRPWTPPPPRPAPELTPIPNGPVAPGSGILYFEVLGPFRITGWPNDQPRSAPVIDLATYLALHPERPFTAEELRDPLSIGKARALEADTIRTYAGTLRRNVGAGHLPDAGRRGYQLEHTQTDWHRFVELTTAVRAGAASDEEARALAQALCLVRGLPFSDLPPNGFAWVATELFVSQIEVAVIRAARQLTDLATTAGDWQLAAWSAERGLAVSPTTQELNAAVLRAAALSGQPEQIAQARRDVTRRYTAAEEPVPDEVAKLSDQLQRRFSTTSPRS